MFFLLPSQTSFVLTTRYYHTNHGYLISFCCRSFSCRSCTRCTRRRASARCTRSAQLRSWTGPSSHGGPQPNGPCQYELQSGLYNWWDRQFHSRNQPVLSQLGHPGRFRCRSRLEPGIFSVRMLQPAHLPTNGIPHSPITHSGTFSVGSGLGSLSVYGWTTNPLVEYYVMECNDGISTGGSQKGTVTSDGASYTIWENQRVNEPSIEGTSTFNQYISIRDSCTSSGTVTVENHFNAWAAAGLNLGTMNFQVIAVESWSGSGSASQSVTN
jgi:hypothetical protein